MKTECTCMSATVVELGCPVHGDPEADAVIEGIIELSPVRPASSPMERPPAEHRALMLRTCDRDMRAYGGFVWPTEGYVEAPDWSSEARCGHGLHGLLWGEGDGYLCWDADARWLVCEIDAREVVDLNGKIKVPRAWVLFVGDRASATEYLARHGGHGRAIVGGTAVAGDYGAATVGYRGTAMAGNRGTATAGDHGTAMVGNHGTATAGDHGTATAGDDGTATAGCYGTATAGAGGTATAGDHGTATVGYRGTATAGFHGTATAGVCGTATAGIGGTATVGNYGTATAGVRGTATAGHHGTATAGDGGTATVGHHGTATVGDDGTAMAGVGGELRMLWYDGQRFRTSVFYVGDEARPNTRYRCEGGRLVEVAS